MPPLSVAPLNGLSLPELAHFWQRSAESRISKLSIVHWLLCTSSRSTTFVHLQSGSCSQWGDGLSTNFHGMHMLVPLHSIHTYR